MLKYFNNVAKVGNAPANVLNIVGSTARNLFGVLKDPIAGMSNGILQTNFETKGIKKRVSETITAYKDNIIDLCSYVPLLGGWIRHKEGIKDSYKRNYGNIKNLRRNTHKNDQFNEYNEEKEAA